MKVRYTYRLRPGAIALGYLAGEWDRCRFVWNHLVAESRLRHRTQRAFWGAGVDTTYWDAAKGRWRDRFEFGPGHGDRYLTHLRAVCRDAATGQGWLAQGSSVAQQQTVRDFAAARAKALDDRAKKVPASQRRGLPRFKKRGVSLPTLNYTRRGFSLRPDRHGRVRLHLPGKVSIPVVWSRELPSEPKSVRVSQDHLGHWYASFVVQAEYETAGPAQDAQAIGIDWGVRETATTARVDRTTGAVDEAGTYDLPHHEHGKKAAAELARHQRAMARRRRPKGHAQSHGYRLAKWKAARAHKKVARQRKDDARKWARKVAADHQHIAVEDFRPAFLAKTTMARKAADAAIAATKAELIWQGAKAGRDVHLVHPKHTTTDCYQCGARTKHRLPLGQRTYTCTACGHVRPRDKNSAAIMVVRAGFVPADIEGIRPRSAATLTRAA